MATEPKPTDKLDDWEYSEDPQKGRINDTTDDCC